MPAQHAQIQNGEQTSPTLWPLSVLVLIIDPIALYEGRSTSSWHGMQERTIV
nr:hypothetical protein [Dyadobacter frigoris]